MILREQFSDKMENDNYILWGLSSYELVVSAVKKLCICYTFRRFTHKTLPTKGTRQITIVS